MSHFFAFLKIHSGEEHVSALLVGLMLFTAMGSAIGGNAIEALFFARFGVDSLPTMYIILGLFTFVTSMAISALMGRSAKQRLYVTLPFILGFALIGEWLIIPLNLKWFFAMMWLGMNVINSLQGLLTWGLAGAACDTRQAKRLFPLFSAGAILGTVIGGLITPPLATWLHSENLLLLWALAMFISYFLGRALIQNVPVTPEISHAKQPSVVDEMLRGYQFVRRSTIMQWVSYGAILFSICFFSLALPFSRAVTAQFPNADQLAGFLGLFQSLNTAVALLASLILANRLFARFGIMPMLLIFPVIYLVGFGVLALAAPFGLLVGVRFAQMAYMNGIANNSWQALFNVVPPDQRDQVRAFVGGVPEQAGTFIAGLVLVIGEQTLSPQQLYIVGLGAAVLLLYVIWHASRDYSHALVAALRSGQPQMFFDENQPFSTDAAAVSVAIGGLSDLDPGIRRISAEIVGHLPIPEATPALVNALIDVDAPVRVAALKGLTRAQAATALLEISATLSDPEPDVRLAAIDSLRQLAVSPRGIVAHVEPILADPEPLVRIQAALALMKMSEHPQAREILHRMATDSDGIISARALEALGKCRDESAFGLAVSALDSTQPLVRKAAAGVIVALNPGEALHHLIHHLNDDDTSVRAALAEALGKIGPPALEPLVEALARPSCEDGALLALAYLPTQPAATKIKAHAKSVAQSALHYHNLALGLAQKYGRTISGDGRIQLLIDSLHDQAHHIGLNVLRTLGLITARETVTVAVENLRSHNLAQRANALETLESVGEREIIRPLLALWESGEKPSMPLPENWLPGLIDDPSAWLRACAVLVAEQLGEAPLRERLKTMSRSDPDVVTRAVAANIFVGEIVMDTLATLSLMQRILFLRRVPLFSGLPPADLKQVAAISNEILFTD